MKTNLFHLDSIPETGIKDRWSSIKIIVGSAAGSITALVLVIIVILRRRYKRLEQEVNVDAAKDDFLPPR